VFRESLDTID